MKILRALSTLTIGCLLLMVAFFVPLYAQSGQTTTSAPSVTERLIDQSLDQSDALPDLVIERFALLPTNPISGASVKIVIRVRNLSPVSTSGGFRTYLYLDPVAEPPMTDTDYTQQWGHFVTVLPYHAVQFELEGYTFEESRNYKVYAWVDRDNQMAESNESNNLSELDIPVSPGQPDFTLGGDDYEPDDECNQATEIPVDGTAQFHFFRGEEADAQDDVDWVKFQTSAGTRYLVRAVGTGAESWPELELREASCDGAVAFGTTASISFTASITGVHYLKLKNKEGQPFVPDLSEYRLTVLENPRSGGEPTITHIEPNAGRSDRNTNITIRGANFDYAPSVELHPYIGNICQSQALTSTSLLGITWVTSQELLATVPANLAEGAYCLSVTNLPDGKASVENGFNVFSGAPDPRSVSPKESYNDLPSQIDLKGFNFTEEIMLRLSNGKEVVKLSEIQIINRNHLRATVPVSLTVGNYDLEAFYEVGEVATLDKAITILQATGDDLFGLEEAFWLDPDPPHAGSPTELVLGVHRQGGEEAISNVKVRFFVDGEEIGDATVPLLSPNRTQNTMGLEWQPSQAGTYTITALIDPDNQLSETSETNNRITKTITVLEPAADELAPHVNMLKINGEQETTNERLVWLDTEATDYPLSGGTDVAEIRYIESEYNQGPRIWTNVQDSNWLPYTTSTTSSYNWPLSAAGGIHYIQAWAKDGAGNISAYPYQASINYNPPIERVERNQTRIYREELNAGQTLAVTVESISGDPDLYIWPPNSPENPPWVSNQAGTVNESLTFQAPISGSYQIEVYGFNTSEYQLTIDTTRRLPLEESPSGCKGNPNSNRGCPSEPAIPVDSKPPTIIDEIVGFKLYLPSIIK